MNSHSTPINWYPGHMAKSRRLISEQIRKADVVIEVCDARLPYSSRNPELNSLIGQRRRILLLNKADLADPDRTAQWIRYFRNAGVDALATEGKKLKRKELLNTISASTEDLVDSAREKGVRLTVRVVVAGVPNVGKSTVINQLHGNTIAAVADHPGVTKNQQWIHITPYLDLLDTPGMLWPRLDDQKAARRLCYIGSVKDDVVDLDSLAVSLLEELTDVRPDLVAERFHIDDTGLKGPELLDAACKGRGWLLKGGRFDYDRGCRIILDEYRAGKLGRITLETPEYRTEVSRN